MTKSELENDLIAYGVNDKVIGFKLFVDLILMMVKDIDDKKVEVDKVKMNSYYGLLAEKYDLNERTIACNIKHAVTNSNKYGTGLTPKVLINNIFFKYGKGGK